MLKKLLIVPFFGPFPEWMDLFLADFMRTMKPQGYDLLMDNDLPAFKERVKEKLGIDFPGVRGSGKVWDVRCALGHIYQEEINKYEFWGVADFDVVFGRMNHFVPDSMLSEIDVYSSHNEYVAGCFSLFRNHAIVNELFKTVPDWKSYMDQPEPNGWVEQAYSRALEQSGLRYKYDFPQGFPWTKTPELKKTGDKLYQVVNGDWLEIGLFHFRHSKRWPL